MRAKLDVTGMADYLNKLARAGADIDRCADEALQAAAAPLHAEIAARVPVDTGDLLQHLHINGPIRADNKHYIYVEIDMRDREKMLYAVYVEFGHGKVAPRSYIRRGVAAGKPRAAAAMKAVFERWLESLG